MKAASSDGWALTPSAQFKRANTVLTHRHIEHGTLIMCSKFVEY